jgi:tetratricopeptide (TPR) repeat protein
MTASPSTELVSEVKTFLDNTTPLLNSVKTAEESVRMQAVRKSLLNLVKTFGTAGYSFNLSIERYTEKFYGSIHPFLPTLLAENIPDDPCSDDATDETDLAFAAYYALSLICKKEHNTEGLKDLIDEHNEWAANMNYPLAYEILSRYYKRIGELPRALEYDSFALQLLRHTKAKTNCAVGISYASTVCRMYHLGIDVTNTQWQLAKDYILDAIANNPDYPKYHFPRGKLLFYSHRTVQDIHTFEAYCTQALEYIDKAIDLQFALKGKHQSSTILEYDELKREIESELALRKLEVLPFLPMSPVALETEIQKVLESPTEDYCRPKNPNLKPGQKFVFISYAHADFKSVYCDLLRLYSRKVCFQYDALLSAGKDWEDEVHQYLRKEECVGVVFFISRNTPFSEAVEKECKLLKAQDGSKFYFSVNLEDMSPTNILMQSVASYVTTPPDGKTITGSRIINFLTTFHDNITYIKKPQADGPGGSRHIDKLINELSAHDPELILEAAPLLPV